MINKKTALILRAVKQITNFLLMHISFWITKPWKSIQHL